MLHDTDNSLCEGSSATTYTTDVVIQHTRVCYHIQETVAQHILITLGYIVGLGIHPFIYSHISIRRALVGSLPSRGIFIPVTTSFNRRTLPVGI